jgi:hypothetical protein
MAYDPSTGDLYIGKNNGELYRASPMDAPLPIDSLVMIYTPLPEPEPEPEPESPSSDSPASSALPTTGVDTQIAILAATIGAAGILSGLAFVLARRGSVLGARRR